MMGMSENVGSIELLAPARDLAGGVAAIDSGADAVYVGPARFGARAGVGNSLEDIERLARHAHRYWVRVYATVNTLLTDDELGPAVRLIHQLDEVGVDGIIVQDVGLLECDLPPLPLIASTQMHNHTPERVAFLEQVGFRRVILARELSLEQIQAIRRRTSIELEVFVHGALCVCYSGQCYLSYAIGGRSGNRGQCAQPCRRPYDLVDRDGRTVVAGQHLLSLRDLNRSDHLGELLDAGVTAFKIEGRLKDRAYVTNVVSHYRQQIDRAMVGRDLERSSSGRSRVDFVPDVDKTFNRGYTPYFLHGRSAPPGAIDTPKMVGELVGRVARVGRRSFDLDLADGVELHNGDGLCFFDRQGALDGSVVNRVEGRTIFPNQMKGLRPGDAVYRNHDHAFLQRVEKSHPERTIGVHLRLEETAEGFRLTAVDEDGIQAVVAREMEKIEAEKPGQATAVVRRQLSKTGGTAFACAGVEIAWATPRFLPFSTLNGLRRRVLTALEGERERNRPVERWVIEPNRAPFPQTRLTFEGNVLNSRAAAFYRRHGVEEIEPAAESGLALRGRRVMRTRYCIKHQLGFCPQGDGAASLPTPREPLYLVDGDGHRYELRFDCAACEMEVYF